MTNLKLEIVVIPVSDVYRAKQFYEKLGWRLDGDFAADNDWRAIQFTPLGSPCSVILGKNVTVAAPALLKDLPDCFRHQCPLVRSCSAAASRSAGCIHPAGDAHVGTHEPYLFGRLRIRRSRSARSLLLFFCVIQRPGRQWLVASGDYGATSGPIDSSATMFASTSDLAKAMRRAETAHGEHEKRMGGQRDENWPAWYASTWSPSKPARNCHDERRRRDCKRRNLKR